MDDVVSGMSWYNEKQNKTHTKKTTKAHAHKRKHLRKMIEKLKHNKLVDNFTSSNAFNTNWAAVQHFK